MVDSQSQRGNIMTHESIKRRTTKHEATKSTSGKKASSYDATEQEKLGDSVGSLGSWGGADLEELRKNSPMMSSGTKTKVRRHGSLPMSVCHGSSRMGGTLETASSSTCRESSSQTLVTLPSNSASSRNTIEDEEDTSATILPSPPPPFETPKTNINSNRTSEEEFSSKVRKGRKKTTTRSSGCHLGTDDWGHLSLSNHQKSSLMVGDRETRRRHTKSPKPRRTTHAGYDTSDPAILEGDDGWGNLELGNHHARRRDEENEIRRRQTSHSSRNKSSKSSPRLRRKKSLENPTHRGSHAIVPPPAPPPPPPEGSPGDRSGHRRRRNKSIRHQEENFILEKGRSSFRRIKYIPSPQRPAATKRTTTIEESAVTPDSSVTESSRGNNSERSCGQETPRRDESSKRNNKSPKEELQRSKSGGLLAMPSPRLMFSKAARSLSNTPRRCLPSVFRPKDEISRFSPLEAVE